MAKVDSIVKDINKEYGSTVVGKGTTWAESDRIPTGWFPLDLACGGGFPMGGVSIVYGVESSLKTSVGLRAIGQCQLLKPSLKNVMVDLEGTYEPAWGERMGVDNEKLTLAYPDYAEQTVDMVVALLQADDIGIVLIDSLAAMIPENEMISSSEKASVGGAGLIISKFYRKMTTEINRQKRQGRYPLVIAINQIRHKIGVMHGNPETLPGGFAFKYASKLTLRMYGKDVADTKLSPAIPPWKEINGSVKKWKVPIGAQSFKFNMATVDIPKHGLVMGSVDSWNTVGTYLKKYGLLVQPKKGKPWVLFDEEYKTLSVLRERLSIEEDFRAEVEALVIKAAMSPGNVVDAQG